MLAAYTAGIIFLNINIFVAFFLYGWYHQTNQSYKDISTLQAQNYLFIFCTAFSIISLYVIYYYTNFASWWIISLFLLIGISAFFLGRILGVYRPKRYSHNG